MNLSKLDKYVGDNNLSNIRIEPLTPLHVYMASYMHLEKKFL